MVRLLMLAVAVCAACALTGHAVGGDPMLVPELALGAVTAAWLALIVRGAGPALLTQRRLRYVAEQVRVSYHDVRVIRGADERTAFVIGPVAPEIFVSGSLLDSLDREETRAVLLHEEHHRRRRDPLRALALAGWDQLLGWLPPARRWIAERHADLEVAADNYALRHGATRSAMASALLKCDRSDARAAMGFGSAADIRIRRLLDPGDRRDVGAPAEWLAPVLLAAAIAACHMFLP